MLAGDFALFEDDVRLVDADSKRFVAEFSYGKLILSLWGDGWSRSWRVVSAETSPERVVLECSRRMGLQKCAIVLTRGETEFEITRARQEFAKKLASMIESSLGFKVELAVSARNDRQNLSGIQTRLLIKDRGRKFAGVGIAECELQHSIDASLGAGLIWVDELKRRTRRVDGLMIFVPRPETLAVRLIALRISAWTSLYRIDEAKGTVSPVAPVDQGDLNDSFRNASRRAHWPRPGMLPPSAAMLVESVRKLAPDDIQTHHRGGRVLLSIRGLEIARVSIRSQRVEFGLGEERQKLQRNNEPELAELVRQTISHRRPESRFRNEVTYRYQPERWLESIIAKDVACLDSSLDPRYAYSQVPTYRGEQRTFIDVLSATRDGRLVVMELKVSEEIEFPFQALDYWLRVEWHRSRGDFQRRGYFEGLELVNAPPLLYLVAPLFRFHKTTKLLAGAIDSKVPIYRIGINEDWRRGVRVLLRERLN